MIMYIYIYTYFFEFQGFHHGSIPTSGPSFCYALCVAGAQEAEKVQERGTRNGEGRGSQRLPAAPGA